MRIGFEGKVLTRHAGGTGRYAINLLRALITETAARGLNDDLVIFTSPDTSQDILDGFASNHCERFLAVQSSLLRALFSIPSAVRKERLDIFHGLDHMPTPFWGRSGKYIAAVHDVISLTQPHLFTAKHGLMVRAGLARVARRADVVVVPSVATRDDIQEHLGLGDDQITVIPAACEPRFTATIDSDQLEQVRQRYKLPDHYILALGTLEPRKNLPRLLQAFAQLRQLPDVDPTLHLVVAGARGWKATPIFRAFQQLGLEASVVFPGFIAEADLPSLYHGAACFAFPSRYEGFGFPVLEALSCGVPVMASNISSIPEVAGEAALLVDPDDVDGMTDALYRLLHDAPLRAALRRKGFAQASRFSWERTAQQTLDLYASLGV